MKYCFTRLFLLCQILALAACTIPPQTREEVLVRHSGSRHYHPHPQDVRKQAVEHWEYAVMSENAYHVNEIFAVGEELKPELDNCANFSERQRVDIVEREDPRKGLSVLADKNGVPLLEAEGWYFSPLNRVIKQDRELWCKFEREALAFIIYERKKDDVLQIAISFRGTVSSYWPNWRNNLRWFLPVLNRRDASSIVQNDLTKTLARALAARFPNRNEGGEKIAIVTTGHSLGGAFAQQFAYAFPPREYAEYPQFKVKKVVVFNPSPVNGWHWVDCGLRRRNAGGMPISRVFQDGEILAYLRLSLSYVYPPSDGDCVGNICKSPRIEEVRYNRLYDVAGKGNMIERHSMRDLAAGLAAVMGHEPGNYFGEKKQKPAQ